jgi:hypothetical protein
MNIFELVAALGVLSIALVVYTRWIISPALAVIA